MRELFRKPTLLTKIEFWALTTIFAFVFFFFLIDMFEWDDRGFAEAPYRNNYTDPKNPFDIYENYFFPQLIRYLTFYIAMLLYNFVLVPRLFIKETAVRSIILLLLVFIAVGFIYGLTGVYLYEFRYFGNDSDEVDRAMWWEGVEQSWMILLQVFIYTAIKRAGIYLWNISGSIEAKYKFIRKEAIIATAIWMVLLLVFRFGRAETEIIVGWIIVVPSAIVLYLYSFYSLIPRSLARNRYPFFFYVFKCAVILFVAFVGIYFILALPSGQDDAGVGYSAFNAFFQFFITVPLTWFLYKRHLKGNEEMTVLKKELKQSSASFDFLRSQINPHFLFNALNTLYGTAIQEQADRTSEGIQKLGDMMRFMLQENMQDKIALSREIDYLNNYISLQKLRTDSNPNIQIQTQIDDSNTFLQIAPMLLIPFVENAFKHGISFREPSHIKVTLDIKDDVLYFDVYNSKHLRPDNDPEKDKSGIGLENVKQRLQLSYPNRHELMIRDTTKEFFVHLTIQLAKLA